MDTLLLTFFTTTDESCANETLEELLQAHVAPVARLILRRKLGLYVSGLGENPRDPDAEDLYQEILVRVVQGLRRKKLSARDVDIENFRHYVMRVALNVCIDYLRSKSPARTRLRDSLRDLFNRHKDLAAWEQDGELLYGFAGWKNTPKSYFAAQTDDEIEKKATAFKNARFGHEDLRYIRLSQIATEIIDWIGGPVDLDTLVKVVGCLLQTKEPQLESFDQQKEDYYERPSKIEFLTADSYGEFRELLTHLWKAVRSLPSEQRNVFSFSFEDEVGRDLFTVLLAEDVVTLSQLSQVFDRSVAEVLELMQRMPMDTAAITEVLKISRETVYKKRFRALQELRHQLLGSATKNKD